MSQQNNDHIVSRDWRGRAVEFSEDARRAMLLLEPLLNSGDLVLRPDRYMGNRLMFHPSRKAAEVDHPEVAPAELICSGLNPLESAIRDVVGLLNNQAMFLAESNFTDAQRTGLQFLSEKLNSHLNQLLSIQLDAVRPG
ncbi:hypothetical protein [Pseudomonas sp. Marseille-P9655]|uniref:hypothetical protein n=1 Tax=Pseudomonas sp. Marseille-P9655 TaxID=2866591 RepID=UPI001CE4ADBA|nr:hypothetical protein [Pseudomonas sp. Marseille-P9655]